MCELSAVRFSIVAPLSVNQQPSSLTWNVLEELFLLESLPDAMAILILAVQKRWHPFVRIKASREPSGLRAFALII